MDATSVRCLINSISRFILQVSCQTKKPIFIHKDYRNMVTVLKHLRPVLDEVVDYKIPSLESLHKECEELDLAVNEAREFLEKWRPNMSKILSELESLESEMTTKHIEEAIRNKRDNDVAFADHLMKIIESVNLASEREFLKESIAVEKERMESQNHESGPESGRINRIVDLLSSIRTCLLKIECFEPNSGAPIPSYFRCPLSLQLMLDPVIVASGQTFERASIQKWLENGLTTCPKTRQTLVHTNLIPNYTVKAMIASWCEENHLKFPNQTSVLVPDTDFSEKTIDSSSKSVIEVGNGYEIRKTESFERQSRGISYIHSRSESTASAVSNISNEVEGGPDGNLNQGRTELVSSLDSANSDDSTASNVKNLVDQLKSQSNTVQTAAAAELRNLSKNKMENRLIIGRFGAVAPLLQLLYSDAKQTQEHAVTALLNLSISEEIKATIAEAGAIEPLIHVLKSGNDAAKENSAAALFSLSVLEEYKAKIGCSGAVKALVNLLATGTLRGKKDAATALFNLSILHENKARIVQAGAVKYLVELMDPGSSMVDKAVALLANLSTIGEGRSAIVRAAGIPLLVEVVESGSLRGKENAASVLLQLCLNSPKFCTLVLQEGAIPPLVALSQSGTTRAKEKAQQLLSHFRSQREASMGKSK